MSDFVASVLSLEDAPAAPEDTDWDCDPPQFLVHILNDRGRVPMGQLQELIVPRTSATLRPRERDAYCPECFQIDVARRALYRRRDWLHSWTMTCAVHGCLLWSYEQVAHAKPPKQQFRALVASEQIRLGTVRLGYVTGFSPPYACWAQSLGMSRRTRDLKLALGRWLDPKLLKSEVGRSLVMLCGSQQADSIYYVLFGTPRSEEYCWLDDLGQGQSASSSSSPRAPIRVRLTAAYTAAAIWRLLGMARRESGEPFTSVDDVLALCKTRQWTDSWPFL